MAIAINPAAVAAIAAEELDDMFRDAGNVLRDGEANYLRDGDPQSVTGRISQAAGRSACRIYGSGTVDLTERGVVIYERACRPYLDSIGQGSGGGVAKPFSGGQCSVRYNVFGTYVSNQTTLGGCGVTRDCQVLDLPGPVQGNIPPEFAQDSFKVQGNGFAFPWQDSVTNAQLLDVPDCGPSVGAGTVRSQQPVITSIVRVDGLADDCGGPPPESIDAEDDDDPNPPPFVFNPAPDIDIDIDVDVFPDGTIEFDIGTGPVSINPTIDVDGGSGFDPTPTDPGSPGDGGSTGSGGDQEGVAPEGQELVGVLVSVIDSPPIANTFGRTSETVYRGVGYVRMGFPNRLGVDVSGGAVFPVQFFHAQQRGLTSYKVSANLGYNLSVTPYYRDTNL